MPTSRSVSHLVHLSRSLPTHLLLWAYPSVDCRPYFVDTPPSGWLKCNVDGAFYEQQWQGATGAVLRDDNGAFVRGGAKWYGHCLDALNMEALACRDGFDGEASACTAGTAGD
jgi:hypothetical protein